jgi:hypothetical protein
VGSLGSWINSNLGSILAIAGIVAGIVAAWWVYRSQQASSRRGVLDGLVAELTLHAWWVAPSYPLMVWPGPDTWWSREQLARRQTAPLVNRLSTVAIDAGIAQGPALFINPKLVFALVEYRQRVEQLNQLIDNAASIQQWPDLWGEHPPAQLVDHFAEATAWVHWVGIGTMEDPPNRDGAHRRFRLVADEVERERNAGFWARQSWFWYGRTWSREPQQPLSEVIAAAERGDASDALDDHRLV